MAQYGRPSSDVSNTGWVQSAGSTLWDCINETVASDTDYIRASASSFTCELGLSSVSDPVSNVNHILRLRATATGSGGAERWTVTIYQGTTLIATAFANTAVTRTTYNDYSYTLTTAEVDAITNYGDLRVRILGGPSSGETISVSYVALEVPDAPATIIGSLNKTLDGLTRGLSGGLIIAGSLLKTLDNINCSSQGTVGNSVIQGRAMVSWIKLSVPGTSIITRYGNLNKVLDSLENSELGIISISGSVSQTLSLLSSNGLGATSVAGNALTTFDNAILVSGASSLMAGTFNQSLESLSKSIIGSNLTVGLVQKTLDLLAVLSNGNLTVSSNLNKSFDGIGLNFSGTLSLSTTLVKTLDNLAIASTAVIGDVIIASLNKILDGVTLNGVGTITYGEITGELSKSLSGAVLNSDGDAFVLGSAINVLGTLTSNSSGAVVWEPTIGIFAKTLGSLSNVASGQTLIQSNTNKILDGLTIISVGNTGFSNIVGGFSTTLSSISSVSNGTVLIIGNTVKTLGSLSLLAYDRIISLTVVELVVYLSFGLSKNAYLNQKTETKTYIRRVERRKSYL